ncbi:MAG TPA: alpha-galactosidase, partial [Treponemataceae bacterium]|nr:alpha-galactosidase [Treponemataceae bacterium]
AGLGDWTVNRKKFPRGLGPLIARVKELGMEFGLWVEPEMVNPDSDLYRAHPDWIYHYPGRTRTEMRNQFVLNLSIPAVEAYVFDAMHRLLSENDIRFVKWDLNRSISEPGSHAHGHPRDANIRHIEALYRIMTRLRSAHPDVRFQTCSGGGGRIDPGILAYFDQAWPSDNTDASDRLVIQEGFSLIYGAHIMESWVTARKNWLNGRELSLEYRFHAAMAGVLGIGENLSHWNEEEAAAAKGLIALYKDIRPLVQNGNLYRLESAERTSFLYAADDGSRAVLFVFLERNRFGGRMPPVHPRGLDPDARYELVQRSPAAPLFSPPSAEIAGRAGMTLSGAAWTERGVEVPLREDHTSAIFEFKRSPLD